MKKSTILLVLLTSFLLFSKHTHAQDYPYAVGLKFSDESGPSFKYFIDKTDALEAILGFRSHGAVFTGLWERHVPILDVDKLKIYYGFGAHIGAVGDNPNPKYDNTLLLGADGVVGVEYVIPEAPIAISLDLDPRLEFGHGPRFLLAPGLGLKYTFK
ncbi:hypothetical protein [Mucilaginibacter boryungensis]|uniref:DUF3575 domain-containing protein n=1 Tax=Mucilaginibacter boryungensis TaxID=768480 RepID=A0ABR9XEX9_9SPHI|nr:hypothetical protein [Mucilaginibacter boryungensis]MBE9665634.1 hypothetical protein [Mucilaginibacter boryungensis]